MSDLEWVRFASWHILRAEGDVTICGLVVDEDDEVADKPDPQEKSCETCLRHVVKEIDPA